MLTGLGRTKGKKKRKQKRHTHENTRTDSAHARSPNVHPHSGTRADAARWWRRDGGLEKALSFVAECIHSQSTAHPVCSTESSVLGFVTKSND